MNICSIAIAIAGVFCKLSIVKIGEPILTRYERARIVGARALQISHGAPVLISTDNDDFRPHDVALKELKSRVLPIGLSRRLPNGKSQVIPIQQLKDREFIAQIDVDSDTGLGFSDNSQITSTSQEDDLTKVTGIGEGSIDNFYEKGFTTITSIADADANDLSRVSGVGKTTAEKLIEAAKEVVKTSSAPGGDDLTKITGIGEGSIENFYESGFTTISSIADASVKDLAKVSGVGKATAEKLIKAAKDAQ